MMQGFYWDVTPGGVWYDTLATYAPALARAGFTTIWFPPPSKGAAGGFDVGYTPYDYYDLGEFDSRGGNQTSGTGAYTATRYGTRATLQRAIQAYRSEGIKVLADIVLNHRSGGSLEPNIHAQWYTSRSGGSLFSPDGQRTYTAFPLTHGSGRIAWPVGQGNEFFYPNSTRNPWNTGDFFSSNQLAGFHQMYTNWFGYDNALHNGDGSNLPLGDSLIVWAEWLIDDIGFDGFRFDFVKGIHPNYLRRLMSTGSMAGKMHVHELYDGSMDRKTAYLSQVAGTPSAPILFDFNLRFAYKELADGGLGADIRMLEHRGMARHFGINWNQIAPFIDNHDFDRTNYRGQVNQEGHSPVVGNKMLWYAHMLTHPGYPQVFWRDYFHYGLGDRIGRLVQIRRQFSSGGLTILTRYDQGVAGPFFPGNQANDERQVYIARRTGTGPDNGLIVSINKDHRFDIGVWVTAAGWENRRLYDITGNRSDTLQVFADGRVFITTNASGYSVWVPVEFTLAEGSRASMDGLSVGNLPRATGELRAGDTISPRITVRNTGYLTLRGSSVRLRLLRDGTVLSEQMLMPGTLRGAEEVMLSAGPVVLDTAGEYELMAKLVGPLWPAGEGPVRRLGLQVLHTTAGYELWSDGRFGWDDAGFYTSWETETTGRGSGFGNWLPVGSEGPASFRYLGSSFGGKIDSPSGKSFGMSSAVDSLVLMRSLQVPLAVGELLRIDLSTHWRDGERGVQFIADGNLSAFRFSVTHQGYGPTDWPWVGGHDHIQLLARQLSSDTWRVEAWRPATGERWQSETLPGAVNALKVFVRDTRNDRRSHLFFNNLMLLRSWQLVFSGEPGWRMITVPVAGLRFADVLKPIWTQGMPGANTEYGTPNVYVFDEAIGAFVPPGSLTDEIVPGSGFVVYVFDDDDFDGTGDGFPKFVYFDGAEAPPARQHTLRYTSAGGQGFHLIGNPFITSLDPAQTALAHDPDLHPYVYIWNPETAAYSAIPTFGESPDRLIAPFQGFWVKARVDHAQLDIPFEARWSGGRFLGRSEGPGHPIPANVSGLRGGPVETVTSRDSHTEATSAQAFILTLQQETGSKKDDFIIHLHEEAFEIPGRFDAWQLQSLSPDFLALYSYAFQESTKNAISKFQSQENEVLNQIPLTATALPRNFNADEGILIPLYVSGTLSSDIVLRVTSTGWLRDRVELIDSQTGKIYPAEDGLTLPVHMGYAYPKNVAQRREVDLTAAGPLVLGHSSELKESRAEALNSREHLPTFLLRILPADAVHLEIPSDLPASVTLAQNFPNPFNPTTNISYTLPENGHVRLAVYNLLGQQVAALVDGAMSAGSHTVTFDASSLSSGVYVYRLEAAGQVLSKRMTLMK